MTSSSGTGFALTFESDETRLYHVQRGTTLAPGSWENVRIFIPGTPGARHTTVSDLAFAPAGTKAFYRVTTANGGTTGDSLKAMPVDILPASNAGLEDAI